METTKFSSKDNFIAAIHEKTADLNPKYQRDDAPDAETFIKYIRTGDDSGLFRINVKISKDEDNKTHPYSLEISKDFTNWYPLPSVSLAQLRNIRDYINKYIEQEERR